MDRPTVFPALTYDDPRGALDFLERAFGAGPDGAIRGSIYVTVPEITREPHDTDSGSREFGAKDPEGNSWSFGTYQPFAYDPG